MHLLRLRNVLAIYSVAALLFVTGTFADLQISDALYMPGSAWGVFFASFGELPALICAWVGAALLFVSAQDPKQGKARKRRWIAVAVMAISLVLSLYESRRTSASNLAVIGMVVESLLATASFAFTFRYADRHCGTEELVRVATLFILVAAGNAALVFLIKIPWGRPRYRSIIVTEGLDYRPWYVAGMDLRRAFEGILPHEEFKSFPSGHAANATCALVLAMLPRVVPRFAGKERYIVAGAFMWIVAVMVARVIAGAHFLTDVTMGFTVTFTIFIALCARVLGRP